MKNTRMIFIFCAMASLLLSCSSGGGGGSGQSSQMSYKDMKSMVLDILKSEDAQKALQESYTQTSGYSAQGATMLSASDQEEIRMAVKDVISSPDYDKVIKSLMTDAKFAGEFAKAVNDQNKDLHKELIKDPQYQEGLISAFESDEMKKVILDVLKTPEYRKELMSLMQESLKNPIFKMELLELMKQAVSSELSSSSQGASSSEGGGGSGSSGGDSSGGGGGSSSGGGSGGGGGGNSSTGTGGGG